jgi:hypothetical protein
MDGGGVKRVTALTAMGILALGILGHLFSKVI